MKISRFHRSSAAFTLVELLVVISIIAILAGFSFTGIKGALEQAKKAQAKNDMMNIVSAVKLFYTEYGRYPVSSTDQTSGDGACAYGVSDLKGNDQIINVLRYIPTATADQLALNPRQIKFVEPKVSDMAKPKSCVSSNAASQGKWFDPWGSQYIIFIDGDYNSDIDPTGAFSGGVALTDGKVPASVGVAAIGLFHAKYPAKSTTLPRALEKSADLISW